MKNIVIFKMELTYNSSVSIYNEKKTTTTTTTIHQVPVWLPTEAHPPQILAGSEMKGANSSR